MSGLRDAILKKNLRAKTFEDLKIPLYVACTNLNSGKVEYFNRGILLKK
jgi:NTE family protein